MNFKRGLYENIVFLIVFFIIESHTYCVLEKHLRTVWQRAQLFLRGQVSDEECLTA